MPTSFEAMLTNNMFYDYIFVTHSIYSLNIQVLSIREQLATVIHVIELCFLFGLSIRSPLYHQAPKQTRCQRCGWGSAQRQKDEIRGAMTPVSEEIFLSGEPLPCSPAAETALQPLIWCSEG